MQLLSTQIQRHQRQADLATAQPRRSAAKRGLGGRVRKRELPLSFILLSVTSPAPWLADDAGVAVLQTPSPASAFPFPTATLDVATLLLAPLVLPRLPAQMPRAQQHL